MVSANTPMRGGNRRNKISHFEFKQNRDFSSPKIHVFSHEHSGFFRRFAILLTLLFASFFFSKLSAQCTADCTLLPATVELDADGSVALCSFFDNCSGLGCATFDIAPASVSCTDIGSTIPVTVTATTTLGQVFTCTTTVEVDDLLGPDITFCPSDVTVQCGTNVTDPVNTGTAAATDNCSSATITYMDSGSGDCGMITRNWEAEDDEGNTSNCVQVITVEDNEVPELTMDPVPADTTLDCMQPFPVYMGTFTVSDNCASLNTGDVTMTDTPLNQGANPTKCDFYSYDVERKWKLEDDCGNVDSIIQIITVQDTTAPVLAVTSNHPVVAASNCEGTVDVNATSTDCAPGTNLINFFWVVQVVSGDTIDFGSGLAVNKMYPAGKYNFIFQSTDPCGNTGEAVEFLEILDAAGPTARCKDGSVTVNSFTGMSDIPVAEIDNGSTDNCPGTLTYTLSQTTVSCSDLMISPITMTLTVTDANGNSNSCTGDLEVLAGSPTALCDTIEVDLDMNGEYALTQTDIDALGGLSIDMCNSPLTYAASPTTYDCDDIGDNTIQINITNSAAPTLTSSCDATVKVRDMMAPAPTCEATANVYLNQNGTVNVAGGLFLAGTPELLMTTGTSTGNTDYVVEVTEATTLTLNYTFNKNTSHSGDRFGYRIDGTSFVWFVSGASMMANPVSVSLNPGETLRIRLRTTNNSGGRAEASVSGIPFDVSGDFFAPNWETRSYNVGTASLGTTTNIDNCTSPFDLVYTASPGTFTCDDIANNPHTVTVSVSDASGNEGTCTTSVNVMDDLAPAFECQDFTAQLKGDSVLVEGGWFLTGEKSIYMESGTRGSSPFSTLYNTDYTVTAKSSVSYQFNWEISSEDTLVAYEQFGYLLNGVFTSLNTSIDQSGSNTVSLNAGDVFGFRLISNEDNLKSNIKIDNISVPFTGDFDPVRWNRSPLTAPNRGRAFIHGEMADNCSPMSDLRVRWDGVGYRRFHNRLERFECADSGNTYTRTLRIRDGYGNNRTCTVNVTIQDVEAPVAGCPPAFSTTLNQDGLYLVENPAVLNLVQTFSFDNCPGALNITASPDTLDCDNIGANDVEITVMDGGGNTATCTTTITVQENTPPAITCPVDMLGISCGDLPADTMPANTGMAFGSDNCSATTVSYSDVVTLRSGPNCFEFDRIWTAMDASGNSSSCTQELSVMDANAPTFDLTSHMYSINAECDSVPAPVHPPIDTNSSCGVYVNYDTTDIRIDYSNAVDTFFAGSKPGEQGHYNYSISRVWTVTDSCGSSSSVSQSVVVTDADSPEINLPDSIVVNTDPGMCRANVSLELTAANVYDCVPFDNLTVSNDAVVGDGEASASGFYQRGETFVEFTVSDYDNAPSTHVVKVVVKDIATPSLACRADTLNLSLSSDGTASIVLSDVVSSASDNCGVDSISIMPNNFTCADLGVNQVDIDAFDEAGNSATCSAFIRIITSADVGGISCPGNVTVDCTASIDTMATGVPTFNATGACGMSTLTFSDAITSGNNRCGVITRTFTISNGTATNSCTQEITIVDNVAPRFLTDVPSDITHECSSIPSVDLVAKDSCSGTFAVTPVDDTTGFDVDPNAAAHYNYSILREWTAEDGCNNSLTVDQVITVQDTEAPVFSFPNPLVIPTNSNSCDVAVNLDVADYIEDACAGDDYLIYEIDGNLQRYITGTFGPGSYRYSVRATDPSGRTRRRNLNIEIQDQQTPDAICIQNVVITLDNAGNATINPDKVDAGSTDNCTPANMLMRSVSPSTFDTGDIGPVQVTLTVTDAAGLTRTCVANGTVVGGTIISADNAVSPEGGSDSIGVSVANFQDVTTFDFEVSAADAGVADVTGIVDIHPDLDANGLLVMTAISNGYFVQWIDTTTVGTPGITLADGTNLFNLEIDVTGTDGDMTDVVVANSSVSKYIGGFATPSASSGVDGSVTVVNMTSLFTLSGKITSETNVLANNVLVELSGTVSGSQTTTTAGTFNFSVTAGADATIEPSKNTGWTEGVTTADAFYTLQHVAGTRLFQSPYVRIAADANADNDVTTFDGFQILQLAVGNMTTLPGNTSWRYVPANPALPMNPFASGFDEDFSWNTVSADSLQIDFVAIKSGDVDSSSNAAAKNANRSAFLMSIENQTVKASGLTVEVPVKAKGFIDVNTIQTSVNFDRNALELIDVIPGVLPNFSKGNINDKYADNGLLATGWLNMESVTLDDNEVLFTLVFQSKGKGFELQNVLEATEDLIPQEVLQYGDKLNNVDFVFESVSSVESTSVTGFSVRQNIPNPFEGQTLIGFTLPQSSSVQLNVTDASGKILKSVSGIYPQGYNEVSLDRKDLPNAGVYFYHVQSDFGAATRKMILMD